MQGSVTAGSCSYGGGLTDNGIVLGTTPSGLSGADISVDVEQSGYIDLVVSDGSERYWKGNDSQGGSGIWNGSTDWLKADGTSASFLLAGSCQLRNLGNAPASLVTINGSRSAGEAWQFCSPMDTALFRVRMVPWSRVICSAPWNCVPFRV